MKIPCFTPIVLAALTVLAPAQTYRFTTLAGQAGGTADGSGSAARFNTPLGIAIDGAGNVFVADALNHAIRKITPTGVTTTLAGRAGEPGYADGSRDAARFTVPSGIAVDAAGNLFVADARNHAIRKISADGDVTTLAGSPGNEGSADGLGAAARFNTPQGVAVDRNGTLYVTDAFNATIRKITAGGQVSTLAGRARQHDTTDGVGAAARFGEPSSLAVDGAGNVFVADRFSHTIRKVTPEGVVTTLAGTAEQRGSSDGKGSAARFNVPFGVAADASGAVYVADTQNATIRKIAADGTVTTVAGQAGTTGDIDGPATSALFSQPAGIAVDPSGALFVSDPGNHTIRRIFAASVATLAGTAGGTGATDGGGSTARFSFPGGVAVDFSGNVFVADTYNHTIRKISSDGAVTTLAGRAGVEGISGGAGASARFSSPQGLATDGAGNVFVADSGNDAIRRISPSGAVTTYSGPTFLIRPEIGPQRIERFNSPSGVAVDANGNVFVADTGNHAIRKIAPGGGGVTNFAGNSLSFGSGSEDGTGWDAGFKFPAGIAVDTNGTLFVADTYNHTIRRITPAGVVTTFAGTAGSDGNADGQGAAARFRYPGALTVDVAGNLFVTDTENHTVRKIDADGNVTTIAGLARSFGGSADGAGASARLDYPHGVAVDLRGALYVADQDNHVIRRGAPAAAARLANLSVRSLAATGADTLIVGFSLAGTGAAPLLLRGIGPTLATFGVAGALADPTLRVDVLNGALVAQNDNWESPVGAAAASATAIASLAASVGAFPLPAASKDAVLLPTLSAATYTAQIGGGTGVTLVEAYDAGGETSPRLVNVSARARVAQSGDALIVGFVLTGSSTKSVVIRAVGPTLGTFGVTGALADPRLQLFSGARIIAENDDWGGDATLATSFAQVGAFALPPASKDAALAATLPAGAYTVQVSGVNNTAGTALVEVYEGRDPASLPSLQFEAEDLAVTSSGATTTVAKEDFASGELFASNSAYVSLDADGSPATAGSEYMEFTLRGIPAGTYHLLLRYKSHQTNRGILRLSVDGLNVGPELNQHRTPATFPERNFGVVRIATTGDHVLRLSVMGRDATAAAHTITADRFTLVPVQP